jgi:alkaline phosphatase
MSSESTAKAVMERFLSFDVAELSQNTTDRSLVVRAFILDGLMSFTPKAMGLSTLSLTRVIKQTNKQTVQQNNEKPQNQTSKLSSRDTAPG